MKMRPICWIGLDLNLFCHAFDCDVCVDDMERCLFTEHKYRYTCWNIIQDQKGTFISRSDQLIPSSHLFNSFVPNTELIRAKHSGTLFRVRRRAGVSKKAIIFVFSVLICIRFQIPQCWQAWSMIQCVRTCPGQHLIFLRLGVGRWH